MGMKQVKNEEENFQIVFNTLLFSYFFKKLLHFFLFEMEKEEGF